MAPKRKSAGGKATPGGKKAKTATPGSSKKAASPPDLSGKESYCAEVGIDMANGGSQAVFQWLCCSIIFGNRLAEKTTIRAAKGLINSGLTTPESVKDASWQEKIDALNSEGNVQRGPSMSERLGETAKLVLEKYDGDLSKLREAAKRKVPAEKKLIKEFKGIGETGLNIFFREAQLQWEEVFPFADASSLKLAKAHGYPSKNAKELAEFVGNDRVKFVALLAALTKDELRGTDIIEEAEKDAKTKDTEKKADAKKEEPKEDEAKDEEMKDVQEPAEPKEDTNDEKKNKDVSKEVGGGQADHAEDKTEAKEEDKAEAKEEDQAETKEADTEATDKKPEPNKQETAQEGGATEDTKDVPEQSAEPEKA